MIRKRVFDNCFIVLKQSFDDLNIMVGDSNIVSSNSARNLGVIFDKWIKIEYHISSVCKSTYFHPTHPTTN